MYAATCARRAVRSTGRSASARAAISEALTAPPCPFSDATETSSPTRCASSSTRTARGGYPGANTSRPRSARARYASIAASATGPDPATSSRDSTAVASRSASASSRSASPSDGTSAGGASRTGRQCQTTSTCTSPVGPGLVHLRHQPQRGPVADHRLLRLQRPRVELRRPAQPQRMPRRGQRDPQPGHPERPQPPQREREPDRPRLTGQPLHPVHRVLPDDREHRVVRRDKSGQEGHFPMRRGVLSVVPRACPHPKDRPRGWTGPTGGVDFPEGCAHPAVAPTTGVRDSRDRPTLQGETTRS